MIFKKQIKQKQHETVKWPLKLHLIERKLIGNIVEN